jgi:hypothetical protein
MACTRNLSEAENKKVLNTVLAWKHKKLASFPFAPDSKLISRVKKMPVFLLMALRHWEKKENLYPYFPKNKELSIIEKYLSMISPKMRKILEQRLIAIYFVENLSGGGLTNWLVNEKNQIYCYIIFPINLFDTSLSQWLSNADSMNFSKDVTGVNWQISIDTGQGLTAFYYALFHEIGHVLDYVSNATPFLWFELQLLEKDTAGATKFLKQTPFTKNVWQDHYSPTRENNFYYRKYFIFPGSGRHLGLEISEATVLYREFSGTAFVSLYSVKNWAEDFADFFIYYHLTQVLKKPYQIRVYKNKKIDFEYEPMKSPKIRRRFLYLENYFK